MLQPTAITPPQAHFRPGTTQTVLQLLKHTYSKKYLRIAQRDLPRCLGECSPVKSSRIVLVFHHGKDGPAILGSVALPSWEVLACRYDVNRHTVLQDLKHTLTPYLSACPHRQHPSSAPQRRLFCLSYAFSHSKQTCFPRKKAYRPKRKNAIQRHQMAIYKLNV